MLKNLSSPKRSGAHHEPDAEEQIALVGGIVELGF
jgi:hypothetical protein